MDWVRFFSPVFDLCILYSGFNAGMIVIERTLKRIPLSKTVAMVFLGSLTLFVLPVRFDAFLQNVYPLFGLAGSCIVICLLFLWMFQKNR